MTKKTAIITTVVVIAFAYLVILVALPALADYLVAYGTSGTGGLYNVPVFGYVVPGVIGAGVIMAIIIMKKGVKKDGG